MLNVHHNNYHSIKPKPLQSQGFSKLVGAICYTNDAFRYSCTGDVEVRVICIESTTELPVRAFAVVYSKNLHFHTNPRSNYFPTLISTVAICPLKNKFSLC